MWTHAALCGKFELFAAVEVGCIVLTAVAIALGCILVSWAIGKGP